jgi:ESF2/ABP1 family protein
MAPEKRNQFLDAEESEDEGSQGYDSDDDLQKGGRTAKRRKIESPASDDEDDGGFSSEEETGEAELKDQIKGEPSVPETRPEAEEKSETKRSSSKTAEFQDGDAAKKLSKKSLLASEAAIKKSGVIYLSRIPPFMKPSKLRSLLTPYGEVNRIFLSPESQEAHTRRVRAGGNKKRSFVDGWIEFVSKRDAKRAVELLNARPIGGKKGTYYRDDVWSMLYLKGFKWRHLTEQIAAENAEREARVRAEVARTSKENEEFVRNVERGKVLAGKKAKADARRQRKGEEVDDKDDTQESRRKFDQTPMVKKKRDDEEQPEQVKRVLSKIF